MIGVFAFLLILVAVMGVLRFTYVKELAADRIHQDTDLSDLAPLPFSRTPEDDLEEWWIANHSKEARIRELEDLLKVKDGLIRRLEMEAIANTSLPVLELTHTRPEVPVITSIVYRNNKIVEYSQQIDYDWLV